MRDYAACKQPGCRGCVLKDAPQVDRDGHLHPDVLFVGAFPIEHDVWKGAFASRGGDLVKSIARELNRARPHDEQAKVAYTYAVRCLPKTLEYKVSVKELGACEFNLRRDVMELAPAVVVALGADAAKALGFKGSLKSLRGNFYPVVKDGQAYTVLVTYHPQAVHKSPGLVGVFRGDIAKAFDLAMARVHEPVMHLATPTAFDAVMAELDTLGAAIAANWDETGKPLTVTVDTETTSLTPYVKEDRVIAVSLSWAMDQGLAFPFEHRDAPYAPWQFALLCTRLEELLGNGHGYVVMNNAKFDEAWLILHYKLQIRPAGLDTMLLEHLVDEDKKGEYKLKDLTRDYFPAYARYEEELHAELAKILARKTAAYKEALAAYKQARRGAFLGYWLGLSEDERRHLAGAWLDAGLITAAVYDGLKDVKTKRLKGALVPTKKYQDQAFKVLKDLPAEHLPVAAALEAPDEEAMTKVTFEDLDLDILLKYAAIDALMTRKVIPRQLGRVAADTRRVQAVETRTGTTLKTLPLSWPLQHITMPLCHVLRDMEYAGMRFDRERAKEYVGIVDGLLKRAEDTLYTELGRRFNPNGQELGKILFEEFKLPVLQYTDGGDPSTNADTIKQLADEHELPFLEALLHYRKLEKVRSTYLLNWLKMSAYDGRIHTSFNQHGTATYRLSSSNPNLQNVPFFLKEANLNLKALFLADSDDFDLYNLDISNAEMRVLCAYSQDEALINAFNEGKDIHCLTAAAISDYSYEDLRAHKEDEESDQYQKRQIGKKVNFGTIYVMGPETLQKQLWSQMRIRITKEQAQEYLDGFFRTYPGVKRYIDSTQEFVRAFHFAYTFTGRRRRFDIAAYTYLANRIARQAVNARIQTSSSDVVNMNIVDLDQEIRPKQGRIGLTVHDSIVFMLPKGTAGVKSMLDRVITQAVAEKFPWLPVTWKYDVGYGPNYGDHRNKVTDAPSPLSLAA